MQNNNQQQLAVLALVVALALLGVVVLLIMVTIPLQQAEAQRGVCGTPGFFPSVINSGNQSLISCISR